MSSRHKQTIQGLSSNPIGALILFVCVMMLLIWLYSFFLFLLSRSIHCVVVYNLTQSSPLFLNQTLVSSSQICELGFFTPDGSSSRYVGIWFKYPARSRKVIWVANRDRRLDLTDQLASLVIGKDGALKLLDGKHNTVWSASSGARHSTAFLLDTGNFILRDYESGRYIWRSFDHPGDTMVPEMKIGKNVKTGKRLYLSSWKSDTDPSPGNFTLGITPEDPPQVFGWSASSTPYWRGGQWDRAKFIGIPDMEDSYESGFTVDQNPTDGTTYYYCSPPTRFLAYMVLSPNGSLYGERWDDQAKMWVTHWRGQRSACDEYGTCGPLAVCDPSSSPICRCLKGAAPKSIDEWNRGNWTGGCVRLKELRCADQDSISNITKAISTMSARKNDVFVKMSQMKLPDKTTYLPSIKDPRKCRSWCLSNCSCTAYSYANGIGCMTWTDDLTDVQQFNVAGKDLFVRALRSKTDMKLIFTLSATSFISIVFLGAAITVYRLSNRKVDKPADTQMLIKRQRLPPALGNPQNELNGKIEEESDDEAAYELPMFDFNTILGATGNFSTENKLGQGGFGPVYKGQLQDGREVAVKRLSSNSAQGMEEFKNELVLISKLQHRNLVKLNGFCIEGDERILVYEYLPNKSLDTLIFDPRGKAELSWKKRFEIVQGIAKGLLYLHQDSCLRIIHRDLKASNILLDEKMNPKISDFGIARMFEVTMDLINTCKIVGTLGYMSPEYAMGGIFSEKSDVYSFGVLLLEIICGRKNTNVRYREELLNLLSYAWLLWDEGRAHHLLDEVLDEDTNSLFEVSRCVHIGLLCVQDDAIDRPNMATVVCMLSGESDLPEPQPPTLSSFPNSSNRQIRPQQDGKWSPNSMTNTMVEGR